MSSVWYASPPPDKRRDYALRFPAFEFKSIIKNFEEKATDCKKMDEPIKQKNGSAVIKPEEIKKKYMGFNSCLVETVLCFITSCLYIRNMGFMLMTVAIAFVMPKIVTDLLIYPCCRLLFGTLYPAYASYKAVRTKNVKEYVKWMMYWIVFALFTCAETFTDVFFNWFPFYYEIKIILVFWLLSPATKGSSILYRKFVHPALCRREQEIDECISKAKEQGYHTVLNLGTKGVNYATSVIMQTAIRGGGGLVQQLRKSYSLSDLSVSDDHSDGRQELDETDDVVADARLVRRSVSTRGRSPRAASSPRVDMFFPEVDVNSRSVGGRDAVNLGHIRSSEDISTSYIPENLSSQDLTRTASVGGSSRTRSKVTRSTFTSIKRPGAAEDNEVIIEEIDDDTYYNPSDINVENTAVMPYAQNINDFAKNINIDDNNIESIYQKYLQLKDIFDSANKNKELSIPDKISIENRDEIIKKSSDSSVKSEDIVIVSSPGINIDLPDKIITVDVENQIKNDKIIDENLDLSAKSEDKVVVIVPDVNIELDDNKNESEVIDKNKNTEENQADSLLEPQKNNEDALSVVSSSNFSSDGENSDSEFNTPNSSPVSTPKVKHKKRPAPPPPITIDSISDILENISHNDTSPIMPIESVKLKSELQTDSKEKSKQKDKKSSKDFLKLLKPSKLAFWKSDDALNNQEKLDTMSNSGSSIYEDSDVDSLVKTNEDNPDKSMGNIISDLKKLSASLDSLNEQFLDATEVEANKTVDTSKSGSDANVDIAQNVQHIPLKVDSQYSYTGSKSTDV